MTLPNRHDRDFRIGFAAMLGALAMLGPFAVDTYLPAFGGMQKALSASPIEMQQTLSAYLLSFGCMFLFLGAISDSLGRKPVIVVSLVLFVFSSVGAALAESVQALILWRVLQGMTTGAGIVVGRAMIRDLYNEEDAQRLMSMVTLFFSLAPVVAPIVGGLLFEAFGWQSIFWFLAAVGVVLVVAGARRLPETLAEEHRHPFHPGALLQGYRVFRASAEMDVPVETLPALRNGYLTFGSFNNFIKISTDVLSLWVELLQQVPDARLVMIVQARESIEYVQDFFAQRGIAPQRVQVHWKLRFDKFLALHNEVDIALDTWPFGGLTTTLHGMWMGVPILTLAGERMLSRSGLSLLAPLELDRDFVAYSRAEYVQKAQQWSRQIPQLAELRAGLRQRLQQSILMDEPGFARDFESRMRACWSEWCAKQK